MPGYKLSTLTQFSPTIIYGLDPEAAPQEDNVSTSLNSILYVPMGQYCDLLGAYLYAQDTILPLMRKQGLEALQVNQLKEWIHGIHYRSAKTLFASYGSEPGKYSDVPGFIWHCDSDLQYYIAEGVEAVLRKQIKPSDSFLNAVSEKCSIDSDDLARFMNLLLKVVKDESIKLSPSQRRAIKTDTPSAKALPKLQAYYYSDRMKLNEKAYIDKLVKVSMPSEQFESAMDDYCASIIRKLQTIDKHNLDEVVALAADAFIGLLKIHPYPNCNGRTATCFLNTLLVYLGQPSILIRVPNEKDEPESSYSKLFGKNEVDIFQLRKHIKRRILDANENPYDNPLLKALIDHRVALTFQCQRIERNHPDFDLNTRFNQIQDSLDEQKLKVLAQRKINELTRSRQINPAHKNNNEHTLSLVANEYTMSQLSAIEKELNLRKAKSIKPTAVNICNKLAAISGTDSSSWRAYRQNTLWSWMTSCCKSAFIFESENETEVLRVVELLNKADVDGVIKKTKLTSAPHRHVLKIENINPIQLFSIYPELDLVRGEEKRDEEEHKEFTL